MVKFKSVLSCGLCGSNSGLKRWADIFLSLISKKYHFWKIIPRIWWLLVAQKFFFEKVSKFDDLFRKIKTISFLEDHPKNLVAQKFFFVKVLKFICYIIINI